MDKYRKMEKERNKSSGTKYIICSIVFADLLVLAIIADLYFMITNIVNVVPIIIITLIAIIITSFLVLCIMGIAGENKKANSNFYNNQMKTLRAIYLMMKKNNANIADAQSEIVNSIDTLSKETLLNQKAASKVVVSRNKENTDALMNSNDIILEKLLTLISESNKPQVTDTIDNSAEIADIKAKLEEISIAIKSGVKMDTSEIDLASLDVMGQVITNSNDYEIPNVEDENQDVVLKGLEEILEEEGFKEPMDDNSQEDELPDLDELLAMTDMLPEEDEYENVIGDIPVISDNKEEETNIEDIPIFVPEVSEEMLEDVEPYVGINMEQTIEPEPVKDPEPIAETVPVMESTPVSLGDMDSNEKMTPEQIAQLIASMTG